MAIQIRVYLVRDGAHERERSRTCKVSLSVARLAALFGITGGMQGYADEEECDDNQQYCDDDLHGYSSLND